MIFAVNKSQQAVKNLLNNLLMCKHKGGRDENKKSVFPIRSCIINSPSAFA